MRLLIPIVMLVLLICSVLTAKRLEPVMWMPGVRPEVMQRALAAGADAPPTTAPTTQPHVKREGLE